MIWVKPANQSAAGDTIYSDWYDPHTFLLSIQRNYKAMYYWLNSKDGGQVSTYYLRFV
jgi:hypothetical protein